jgi:ligand-binding sensor domain-containing protein
LKTEAVCNGVFTVVLLAVLASAAPAVDPDRNSRYIIDFWQEDSGLPQRYVYVIQQTRDGYMWIGTRGGLARFDGVRFTIFDDRNPEQLRESEVMALAEDLEGGLWVGTHGGGVSRLYKGKFVTYAVPEGLPNDFVGALACTKDGSVWIGTERGLVRMSQGRSTFYGRKEGLPHENVRALYADADGTVWIGTQDGLASISAEGGVANHAATDAALKGIVTAIVGDRQGGLWLGVGRSVIHFKERVLRHLDAKDGLPGSEIAALCLAPDGTLWIAVWRQLFRFAEGRVERFDASIERVSGNRTVQVSSFRTLEALFMDSEGSVWVGTGMEGLARIREAAFKPISVGQQDGHEERVPSVFADSRGAVWLGMASGGVTRVTEGVPSFFAFPGNPSATNTIFEDRDGIIWAANDRGVYRQESGTFVAVPLVGMPDTDARMSIIATLVARDGTIWLGDGSRGLLLYRGGRFMRFPPERLPGVRIRALAEDRSGAVWIGMKDGGLVRVRGEEITRYSVEQGLPNSSVHSLYVDKDDSVWVGTRRGLVRIRNGELRVFSAQNGLPVNYFYQIVEDHLGYLWMTCGRGIVRVRRQDLNDVADGKATTVESRVFGTESGLKTTSMVVPNQPAASVDRNGRVWFASGAGAAVVDPNAISKNPVPPPVWIEEIRVDKKAYAPKADIEFPAGAGEVEIEYAGLSFLAPERVQFRYRLEGFDEEWVEARTRRVAFYTNLPPGPFRFRVLACNNDGVWNETGDALRFVLRPHWYQRRSTHAAAVVLFCAMLAGAYRWRVREHKRRAVELARKVEEAVGQVKMLRGMLPICAGCKKIRDDTGYWNQMESYISNHSEADFSHGMCPECLERLYPDYAAAQRGPSS